MAENKVAISRHFFKVLISGFQENLKLPQSFCTRLKQEKSKWAMLKSRKGTSKIKVCRNGEGVISFQDGWPQFVDHHSLCIGDFVVFEYVGRLKFNVFVFGPNACEKEFLIESKRENDNHEAVNPSRPKKSKRATVMSDDSRNPHFFTTMTPFHEKYTDVGIPMKFARLYNLGKKKSATLRDGGGRSWAMSLAVRRSRQCRLTMCGGWRDFYVSNRLKAGDVCVFFLKSSSSKSTNILFDVEIRPSI